MSTDLVVVGSINVDLTATIERFPRPGETVGGGQLRREVGGKGANQAVAASRLGGRVRMIGAVGDDADGRWCMETIGMAGVDTSGVRLVDVATGTALITVDGAGENQIVVCPAANDEVRVPVGGFAEGVAVLTQFELPEEVVLAAARGCRGFLVVNAAPARPVPPELVERADLFIVNEAEHRQLPELARARLVAVTYGADGAALIADGTEIARVAAVPTTVVSTVGAGDAFSAALTLSILAGASGEDALRTACAAASAAVAHSASQPPLRPLAAYGAGRSGEGV